MTSPLHERARESAENRWAASERGPARRSPREASGARIEKLREAESLLLKGYQGMKDYPEAPDDRKREALERMVNPHDTWHAAEWRAKLEEERTNGPRDEGAEEDEPVSQPAAPSGS